MKKKSLLMTAVATLGLTAATMAQTVPSYVPTNGLVGWWPFNGNANDESGNGNNGTVNGATLTTDRFGNVGKAYSFDGIDNYITLTNYPTSGNESFSIFSWILTPNLSTRRQIISYGSNTATQGVWLFISSDNHLHFDLSLTPGPMSIENVGDSSWHFVGVTNNSGEIQLYVDGIISGSSQIMTPNITIEGKTIGSTITNDNWYFNGKIDDIGIWNRALTDQEISDLYNANICYDYVTVTDTLVINTGITGYNPITYLNTLKIWPNPSNDHITIDAGNLATMNGYSIKIEDAQGQQVFQNAVNQQQFYVDITTWGGNGLYFVRIIDPQGNTVDIKKIVLQ